MLSFRNTCHFITTKTFLCPHPPSKKKIGETSASGNHCSDENSVPFSSAAAGPAEHELGQLSSWLAKCVWGGAGGNPHTHTHTHTYAEMYARTCIPVRQCTPIRLCSCPRIAKQDICMYIYIYIMYVRMYVCMYTYMFVCIYTYICMYMYMYMCLYIHTYTGLGTHTRVCVYRRQCMRGGRG